MKKLTDSEIKTFSEELTGWAFSIAFIEKTFIFKSHSEAFAFLTQAALIAERLNHHPNWSGVYNKVTLKLYTHDIGGLSNKDIEFAKNIEKIL